MWRESIVEGLLLSSSGTVRLNGCHEKSKNSGGGESLRPGYSRGGMGGPSGRRSPDTGGMMLKHARISASDAPVTLHAKYLMHSMACLINNSLQTKTQDLRNWPQAPISVFLSHLAQWSFKLCYLGEQNFPPPKPLLGTWITSS